MADVTLTAGSVAAGTGAVIIEGVAGETIAQGKAVYLLASTNEYMLADCTDADTDAAVGFALTASIDGGPIRVQTGGNMTTAADLTAGVIYVLSESGLITPSTDFAAAYDALVIMGAATTTTNLMIPTSGPLVTSYGITG